MKNNKSLKEKLKSRLGMLLMSNCYCARKIIKFHMKVVVGAAINGIEYKEEDEIEDFTKLIMEANKNIFYMLSYYICQFWRKKYMLDEIFPQWEKWIETMKEYESITQLPVFIEPAEKLFKHYFLRRDNE